MSIWEVLPSAREVPAEKLQHACKLKTEGPHPRAGELAHTHDEQGLRTVYYSPALVTAKTLIISRTGELSYNRHL